MATGNQSPSEKPHAKARVYFWITIACGAIPLAIGSIIYWTWRYTRWDVLHVLGLLTVCIGLFVFIVGAFCLFHYWSHESRRPTISRDKLFRQALVACLLLLANFPAAAFYALSAVYYMEATSVHVENASDFDIDSFVITGPGVHFDAGPIRAGDSWKRYFQFTFDGTLDFTAHQQEQVLSGQLSGYVTGGIGGRINVTVKPGATFEVDQTWGDD